MVASEHKLIYESINFAHLSPVQTDTTLLASDLQHCWELLRSFARS